MRKSVKIFGSAFLAIMLIAVLFFIWKNLVVREGLHRRTLFVMDTYFTIQAYGPGKKVNDGIDRAFTRMEEIDLKFSIHRKDNILFRFNAENAPVSDEEILSVIGRALSVSDMSEGAFDVTIPPLMQLWGFYKVGESSSDKKGEGEYRVPGGRDIGRVLRDIGYRNLVIRDGVLTKKRREIQVDLGGITKGYAIGEAARVLRESGIDSALIDGGGDIYAMGTYLGRPWKVGIRNPRGEGVIGVLEVSNQAVVTSGDYERYFERGGVRYHHIMDPKTGLPARGLMSVTVISPDPIFADAWSTTLFVLGKDKGMQIVEKTRKAEAVMVTSDGIIIYSSGLKDKLQLTKPQLSQ